MKSHITSWAKQAVKEGKIDLLNDDIYVVLFDVKLNDFVSTKRLLGNKSMKNGFLYVGSTYVQNTQDSCDYVVQFLVHKGGRFFVISNLVPPSSGVNDDPINLIKPLNKDRETVITLDDIAVFDINADVVQ